MIFKVMSEQATLDATSVCGVQLMSEPSIDDLITQSGTIGASRPHELQYIRFLRNEVFYRLKHRAESPEDIRQNWPMIRADVLKRHGYGEQADHP